MKTLFRFYLVVSLALFFGWAHAQEAADEASASDVAVKEIVTVEGITEYQLDNGLRFLLFPDQSKQQITVNITYLVGSRHEAYGETGMAHLLEHLLFKGSTKHPDITKELSERGALPNGTTWTDRTNYFETFKATDENLDWALDLEADRMVNSFVRKEDLDSEMTVVRNEWERGENNPVRILSERVSSMAFLWHNYGNSTIGARSDIENVPIERLRAFYRKYYQPDNSILVVAGNFDVDRAKELVAEKFGSIPRPERTGDNILYDTYTRDPAQDGERTVSLRRVGDIQVVNIAHHVPAATHPDFAPLAVLGDILSTVPSGRLYKNLVETEIATNAFSGASAFREPSLNTTMAIVRKEKDLKAAEEALLATIDELKAAPPTDEELTRIKNQYTASFENQFNNPQGIARQISEWAAQGDWRLLFIARDAIEEVTAEDVQRVAQKYFVSSNRTTGYFYPTEDTPERVEIEEAPSIASIVEGYKGREAVEMGEAFDPSFDNIDSRTEVAMLDNGVKVVLLPKKTRGATVSLQMGFPHGTEATLTGEDPAGRFAGSLLMRGTKSKSREEITDILTTLKANGGVGGGLTRSTASFSTVRESLPELIPLIGEILQEPAYDEKEFELMREQSIANIESSLSDPQAKASNRLNRHMNPYPAGHPRYIETMEEQLELYKELQLEEVIDFHTSFYGSQHGQIAVVGDFDRDEVFDLLNETFGSWNSSEAYERVPSPHHEVESLREIIETPDKPNAIIFAELSVPIGDDDPDYPALVLGNYLLGGGFLSSRLAERIRQKDGLSYGVGSQFFASSYDDQASISAYAIFAPENSDKVLTAMREEIAKVQESGFTQEEMDAGRTAIVDRNKTLRASDGNLSAQLLSNAELGRNMQFSKGIEESMLALTLDELNETFKKHVSFDALSIVRGGDFAGAAMKESGE